MTDIMKRIEEAVRLREVFFLSPADYELWSQNNP